ncbi:hypothetical protein H8E50_12005 [bacterium]|nr:hypothetical protein [bacterium]
MKKYFFTILAAAIILSSLMSPAKVESAQNPMTVHQLASTLIAEHGLQSSVLPGASYADIVALLPDTLGEMLEMYQSDTQVSRKLIVEILSSYLLPADVNQITETGEEEDILETDHILSIVNMCIFI